MTDCICGGHKMTDKKQAKNKLLMLKVLKELTGGKPSQAFASFGADDSILRHRRSTQYSEDSPKSLTEAADVAERNNLLSDEQQSHAQGTNSHKIPPFIILHYSPFKAVWDWITLLLVLYTAVFTPFMAAFMLQDRDIDSNSSSSSNTTTVRSKPVVMPLTPSPSDPLSIIDMIVDIMFIADILINFRTTYLHNGEVVIDPCKISLNYMKSWFLIDAAAAIPFDLLLYGTGTSDTMTVTGVLKTARLLRLLRVARRIDQYSEYGAAVLVLLMATFTLIAHWLACLFYAIAYVERPYLPQPIGWLHKLAEDLSMPYYPNDTNSGPDIKSRYITSLYFTFTILTSVGFGNIAAVTDAEKVFTIFAMLVGSLMSAAIFGNVSSIMLRLYRGTEEYHEMLTSIREFIKFHYIPKPLANRLVESYQHSRSFTHGVDMNCVLKGFPDCLQADICLHLNRNLLSTNPAFKQASPGCLRALSMKFKSTHAPPGDTLIHPGDILDSIYFIARGSIEIVKDNIFMAILGKDDIFGEDVKKSYFDDSRQAGKSLYTVNTISYCDLHKITIDDLQAIMDAYPEFAGDFLQNFGVTFNLRETCSSCSPSKENTEMMNFIRQRRRRSYFPDASQQSRASMYRSTTSAGMSNSIPSTATAATTARIIAAINDRRFSSSQDQRCSSNDDCLDPEQTSFILQLSPNWQQCHVVWSRDQQQQQQLSPNCPCLSSIDVDIMNVPDEFLARHNHKKTAKTSPTAAVCYNQPEVTSSTSGTNGDRKSWQSLSRLKQGQTTSCFRPRTLTTNNQQWTAPGSQSAAHSRQQHTDYSSSSSSCQTHSSCGYHCLLRCVTADYSSASNSCKQQAVTAGSPPATVSTAPDEPTTTTTQTHSALSPIASGSSSLSYAPKSSPSICGGTAAGVEGGCTAAGVLGTPDDSAAGLDTTDGLVSVYAGGDVVDGRCCPADVIVVVDGLVTPGFLLDVDERLRAINMRMGNFERDLCSTVDSILEVLGHVPSVARRQHCLHGNTDH